MGLRDRHLRWDGCLNVRDLGGHRTDDGGQTRFGSIVRADSVRQLSDAGWAALVDYGVGTVVDLRTHGELENDPPSDLPVAVVHVPFLGDFDEDPDVLAEVEAASAAAPDDASSTRDVYLIFLERYRDNVAAAVRAVVEAPDGGVVVHCAGGKDRTGLVTALLLRLAGARVDDIAADYALSEVQLRDRHEQWIAEAPTEAERERLRRVTATPARAMVGVLDELDRRYGSVEQFLREGGLSDEELVEARARLRG